MYDKTLLAKTTGASLGVVALVGLLFVTTGTAFALPVAGIGGFQIQADRIEGDDMLLYPGIADATNQEDAPVMIVELRENRIDGLELSKRIDLEDFGADGELKLVIESGDGVVAEELLLKTPGLTADEATFSGLEIGEDESDDLNEVFEIRAPSEPEDTRQIDLDGGENPGLVMKDANIQATYLATNEITLPELKLTVKYDRDGDGDFEFG
jgi:hypothetical protein